MLDFSVHEITLGSRSYLVLPKLNSTQMGTLRTRLKMQGFAVSGDSLLTAKREGLALRVDPDGLCWSSSDPSDLIVPAIPELLAARKEPIPLEALARRYFTLVRSGSGALVRFDSRLERGGYWRLLRATGLCGLTPDEHAILLFLLRRARGEGEFLTDYPTSSGRSHIIGGRQYFLSRLSCPEAGSTLRSVGMRRSRNSYLPRDAILRFRFFTPPSRRELGDVLGSLDEWCYLSPS